MALKANSRATDERKEAAAKVARREAKAAVEAGRREIREAEQAEAIGAECDTARFGHGCAICDEAAEEDEAEGFCPCGLALENGECPGAESALDGLVS